MRITRKLLLSVNEPLRISQRPFKAAADEIGISEKQLLSALKSYRKQGLIRRVGAILGHRKIGLKANALVAWKVRAEDINKVAKILISYPEISHCYLRSTYPSWLYNIYTMLHASNRKSCEKLIKLISQKTRIKDYRIMFTLKEFKKARLDLSAILGYRKV